MKECCARSLADNAERRGGLLGPDMSAAKTAKKAKQAENFVNKLQNKAYAQENPTVKSPPTPKQPQNFVSRALKNKG